MTEYVKVFGEDEEFVRLPITNCTLLLTTLESQYPGVCGLRFRNKDNDWCGVECKGGTFVIPNSKDSFHCVFPRGTYAHSCLASFGQDSALM